MAKPLILTLAVLIAGCSSGPPDHRVLFVGNSYTFGNDMPAMVEKIADANGVNIEWTMIAEGGAYLDQHHTTGNVTQALQSGEYDTVVFQEQSVITSVPDMAAARTIPAALALDSIADTAGVRVVWFQTWGHQNGFAEVGHTGYTSMQTAITATYDQIGSQTGGTIARVGDRWQQTSNRGLGITLYHPDGSHASPAGSYVAALEIADAIIAEPLIEAPSVTGVDSETAALLAG